MTDSTIARDLFLAIVDGDSSIPDVGDQAYYFPEGHGESSFSVANRFSAQIKKPHALCEITGVKYLADEHSDEPYAKYTLVPCSSPCFSLMANSIGEAANRFRRANLKSFAKILTTSDASNGGGFSVPKFCADTVFPPLDKDQRTPKQILEMEDMKGKKWAFRHVYRGSPKRNLLTAQWSKFCDAKHLCKDDTVVFVNREGRLYIGIRRSRAISNTKAGNEGSGVDEVSNRVVRDRFGKVSEEEVVEAIRAMERGESFEVSYYPRVGGVKYIIGKEVVEDSLKVGWKKGMRFSMDVQKSTGETASFWGQVVGVPRSSLGSYWKMIKVSFDDSNALHHVTSTAVSPWEIRLSPWEISPMSTTKRPRLEFDFFAQDINSLTCSPYEYLNYSSEVSPAGMQVARLTVTYESFLSTLNAEPKITMSNLTAEYCGSDKVPATVVIPGKKARKEFMLFGVVIRNGDPTEENESSAAPSVCRTDDGVASDGPVQFIEFL